MHDQIYYVLHVIGMAGKIKNEDILCWRSTELKVQVKKRFSVKIE